VATFERRFAGIQPKLRHSDYFVRGKPSRLFDRAERGPWAPRRKDQSKTFFGPAAGHVQKARGSVEDRFVTLVNTIPVGCSQFLYTEELVVGKQRAAGFFIVHDYHDVSVLGPLDNLVRGKLRLSGKVSTKSGDVSPRAVKQGIPFTFASILHSFSIPRSVSRRWR
jgi:hypothetical protein